MIVTGKTITQLPNLITPTLNTALPAQEGNSTYNVTVDNLANTLATAEPFMNISANFYSNPQVYTEDINIPQNSNAIIIGPTITVASGVTISVPQNSVLRII
jgi:hypothetical protein